MAFADQLGYAFDRLSIGMEARLSRTVTEDDLKRFAALSGDTNPMHLDPEFAQHTMFKGCIAHGMFTAGLISALIGTQLPGPGCLYLKQDLKFTAPVRVGDIVDAHVEVTALYPEKQRVALWTCCKVGDVTVLEGEALVKMPHYSESYLQQS